MPQRALQNALGEGLQAAQEVHAGSICLALGSVALCGANGLLHVLHKLWRKGVGELGQGAEGALAGAERLDAKACGTAPQQDAFVQHARLFAGSHVDLGGAAPARHEESGLLPPLDFHSRVQTPGC